MKTADTHTTTSSSHAQQQADSQPFFQPEREQGFFGGETAAAEPFFSPSTLQPKLKIGAPNDKYEQEADSVADQVVQRLAKPETTSPSTDNKANTATETAGIQRSITSLAPTVPAARNIQRQEAPELERQVEETEEETLQRKPIFDSPGIGEDQVQRKCASCEAGPTPALPAREGVPSAVGSTDASRRHLQDLQLPTTVQRKCAACEAEEGIQPKRMPAIQRSGDGSLQASDDFSSRLQRSKGGGSPMSSDTRSSMEGAMGADFTGVRVHTGSEAASLSNAIGAQAFTHGSDVYFNEGKYDPGSSSGQHLLAHELTHTVQQGGGLQRKAKLPAPGSGGGGGNYGEPVPDGTPVAAPKEDCPDLIPPFPKPSNTGGTKEKNMDDDIVNQLLSGISFSSMSGPFGLISALGGMTLSAIWDNLPLVLKIKAIDAALSLAEQAFLAGRFVGRFRIGKASGWVAAGLLGFVRALKKQDGVRKVALFEKMAKIAMGKSLSYTLGVLKGLVMGIFIDGLVGIIQLIIDLFCLVPKIIQFFKSIKTFFEHIPADLVKLLYSIEMTKASIRAALDNAIGEFLEMVKNPSRAIGLLNAVYDIGAGAAEKMGHKMGEAMISYASLSPFALGEIVGRIGGMVIFELLLTYFTAGAGGFVSVAKIGLRLVGKALMKIGKYIFSIVKFLGFLLNKFKTALTRISKFLSKGLKKITGWLGVVIDDIKRIFGKFQRYCRPGSVVCLITTISKRKVSRIRKAFKGLPDDQVDEIIKALDTKFARGQISNSELNWVLRKIEAVSDPHQKQILGLLASDTRTPWSMLKRAAAGKMSKGEWMRFSSRLRGIAGETATELLEAAGKLKLGSKSVKITGKQVPAGSRSIDFKVKVEGRSYEQLLEIKATTPASWKKGMDAYLKKAGGGRLSTDEIKASATVERMLEQLKAAKLSSGKTPILGVADSLSASELARLKSIIQSGASIRSPQILKVSNEAILEVTRAVKASLGI